LCLLANLQISRKLVKCNFEWLENTNIQNWSSWKMWASKVSKSKPIFFIY
jgi:hypothetical protein